MFAAPPPLPVRRWIVSQFASQNRKGPDAKTVMTLDSVDMEREVCIESAEKDARTSKGGYVGLLKKSMYGSRDAPFVWQKVAKHTLQHQRFYHVLCAHCTFVHSVAVHVGDALFL